jgi:hypothetical protein
LADYERGVLDEMPAYIAGAMGQLLLQRADKLLLHVLLGWRRLAAEQRARSPAQRILVELRDVLSTPPHTRGAEEARLAYEAFLAQHNPFVAALPQEVALELCRSLGLLELYKDNKVHRPVRLCAPLCRSALWLTRAVLFSPQSVVGVRTKVGEGDPTLRFTTRASRRRRSTSCCRVA